MRQLMAAFTILAFGPMLHAQFPSDTPVSATLTIKAYVDGPSELHITQDGVYWINGDNAKPGRHDGAKLPTYVNGDAWFPLWHKQREDRGPDRSFSHVVHSDSLDFDCKLIAVDYSKDGTGMVKRSPIVFGVEGGEYVVHIPDLDPGAMWYTLILSPHKGAAQ